MKVKFLTAVLATLLSFAAHAEIRTTDSLKPIEQEFEKSSGKTLILLDIGHTLLTPKDPVFHSKYETWKRDWLQRQSPAITRSDLINAVRIIESEPKNWELVDSNWPELVTLAQKRGAKVVAFTKVFRDPSLKGIYINNLRKMGLPIQDALSGLPSGQSYEYADGVIQTEADLKGPVLEEILSHLSERPEKIIVVEDRIDQIESLEKSCAAKGISCTAFHYTACQKKAPVLDEAVANLQLKTLMKQHRWISEEEARKQLKNK